MKRILATMFCLVLFGTMQIIIAQNIDSLVRCAHEAYKAGQFVKSSMLLELAINAGSKDPFVLYNASCCFALSGRKEKAWKYLERSVEEGFNQAEHMQKDTDLISLHSDPKWKNLIQKIKPKEAEANLQSDFDAITNDINNISANAYQYMIRPKSMAGGGGSYLGYELAGMLRFSKLYKNAEYTAIVFSSEEVDITGTSKLGNGSIKGRLNLEGRIFNWEYMGAFEKIRK
jgi:hypothetical protein